MADLISRDAVYAVLSELRSVGFLALPTLNESKIYQAALYDVALAVDRLPALNNSLMSHSLFGKGEDE